MPALARVGIDGVPGGLITGPGAPATLATGSPVACIGDAIAPHPPNTGLHLDATITTGSATVLAGGRGVAYLGSMCSCGHTIISGDAAVEVT